MKHSFLPPKRDRHYVHISSECPHCGAFNIHRANNFYRVFICVESRCDKCQNSYYIIPPQDSYPAVHCATCEERVHCLINGSVEALEWKEGFEFDAWELQREEMERISKRNWIRELEQMREWKK